MPEQRRKCSRNGANVKLPSSPLRHHFPSPATTRHNFNADFRHYRKLCPTCQSPYYPYKGADELCLSLRDVYPHRPCDPAPNPNPYEWSWHVANGYLKPPADWPKSLMYGDPMEPDLEAMREKARTVLRTVRQSPLGHGVRQDSAMVQAAQSATRPVVQGKNFSLGHTAGCCRHNEPPPLPKTGREQFFSGPTFFGPSALTSACRTSAQHPAPS